VDRTNEEMATGGVDHVVDETQRVILGNAASGNR